MGEYKNPKYIQEYMKEKYHRVPLDLKKEEYEKMTAHAKSKGYDKVNAYIKDLIKKDLNA